MIQQPMSREAASLNVLLLVAGKDNLVTHRCYVAHGSYEVLYLMSALE